MSRAELESLLDTMSKGLSEDFRKEIDRNRLIFSYSVGNIASEIRDELELIRAAEKDPSFFLDDNTITRIATDTANKLDQAFLNSRSPQLEKSKEGRAEQVRKRNIFVEKGGNSFRILGDIVRPVRKDMIKSIEEKIGTLPSTPVKYTSKDGTKSTTVQNKEFFNIEHLTTVSDLRMAETVLTSKGSARKAKNFLVKLQGVSSPEVAEIIQDFILTPIMDLGKGSTIKDLTLRLEWKSEKRNKKEGREEIQARRRAMVSTLERILASRSGRLLGGSDNLLVLSKKRIVKALNKSTKSPNIKKKLDKKLLAPVSAPQTVSPKKFRVSSKQVASEKHTLSAAGLAAPKQRKSKGEPAFDLRAYINSLLFQRVSSKMIEPSLRFRTGRFAASAQVTNVTQTPQGFPSIEYTYLKEPYQLFETKPPWATLARDPKVIIGSSIREIAATKVQGRFYLRRV